MTNTTIKKALLTCGLSPNAARLYIECLRRKATSRKELSAALGIAESTTKDNLDRLVELGMLSSETHVDGRKLTAIAPSKALRSLIAQQRAFEKQAKATVAALRSFAKKRK